MSNSHKELRDSLARWFGDVADARRLAREAGLDLSRIDFSGSARTIWFHVLEEAARVARVDALRALGAQECPSESAFGGGPASDRGGGAGGRAARPLPLSLLLVASAADRELLGGLERALRPLLGEGLIRIDTTTDVAPGEDRHAALSCMIEEAEVIVPLVSSDLFVCEEWGGRRARLCAGGGGPARRPRAGPRLALARVHARVAVPAAVGAPYRSPRGPR